MANVSINSIKKDGTTTTLEGVCVSGATVVVQNSGTELNRTTAGSDGDWSISFPSSGNDTVTVSGGGPSVTVIVTGFAGVVVAVVPVQVRT